MCFMFHKWDKWNEPVPAVRKGKSADDGPYDIFIQRRSCKKK